MAGTDLVHGEAYVDGDASGGIAMTLYEMGTIGDSVVERELGSTEFLSITDLFLLIEAGGDFAVYAGTDAAGQRLLIGAAAALGGVDKHYQTPIKLAAGVKPTLVGPSTASKRNTLIIEGYITKA